MQPPIRQLWACVLLLTISVPALTLRLGEYPAPWFDEGSKINAARSLALRGVYGTYTVDGDHLFDPAVTAGPVELAVVALSFRLLGTGITQGRAVIVLFTLLALFSLYAIAVRLYGRRAGLFVVLVLLAMPPIRGIGFLLIGRQVLGETPCLAMIMLGLWLWFRSWRDERRSLAVLSGLCLGCGLLSKTQVGVALLPTLMLIGVARGVSKRTPRLTSLTPTIVASAIVAGWLLAGRVFPSEATVRENQAFLFDAIRTTLLTGLLGRNLSRSAAVIVAVMGLGVASSGWRLLRRVRAVRRATDEDWAEATITLFVFNSALWFALLSIGWPRYGYAGLVASQVLIGKLAWDTFASVQKWLGHHWPAASGSAYAVALASLALMALAMNLSPIARCPDETAAQQAADYIRREIPREAVIESWEWELDVPSSHWQYHHPDSRYLFVAVRQRAYERQPLDLRYDMLRADPDYLVTGPFSNWSGIYDSGVCRQQFQRLAAFGPYEIYKRSRRE